jgi:hypothetical protein
VDYFRRIRNRGIFLQYRYIVQFFSAKSSHKTSVNNKGYLKRIDQTTQSSLGESTKKFKGCQLSKPGMREEPLFAFSTIFETITNQLDFEKCGGDFFSILKRNGVKSLPPPRNDSFIYSRLVFEGCERGARLLTIGNFPNFSDRFQNILAMEVLERLQFRTYPNFERIQLATRRLQRTKVGDVVVNVLSASVPESSFFYQSLFFYEGTIWNRNALSFWNISSHN